MPFVKKLKTANLIGNPGESTTTPEPTFDAILDCLRECHRVSDCGDGEWLIESDRGSGEIGQVCGLIEDRFGSETLARIDAWRLSDDENFRAGLALAVEHGSDDDPDPGSRSNSTVIRLRDGKKS